MTSKAPTAVEEIQSRIETLNKQIEQYLQWASEAQDQAKEHNDTAARIALLRTQYKQVLQLSTDPRATLIEVNGAIDNPSFVSQINHRGGDLR